ncbi:sugar porter family MFS transporter [Flagellimonas taeanensis]|uniref:sugar porter family MFS transporter n=1 Tax=Flavobacteriaceae TaxID=49546 RepID=UPI000E696C5A|nr:MULTISPECIES: sugar porter family MFS transporter [Allomuricauda]MDC6385394.1 sugar porter family MFS transporter [Muricauda sp. SK9]RIV53090.1 sugar porter family MFS transporter [Allomuricauda taeanensis]
MWSFTASLAGFLFGFDTVVISGANLPIKELWDTSPWFHGTFIMSMALWGTVLGSLLGGIPSQRLGRKKTLIWIGALYFISALGSGLAPDPYSFSFFRFIGGLGVGASTVAGPMYISEISTAKNRGRLVALYQFNLVLGILIAFFSNYLLKGFDGDNDWRWMMGVEGIPAAIYFVSVFFIPNSPRWLVTEKQNKDRAREVLEKMGVDNVEEELQRIEDAESIEEKQEGSIFKKYRKSLLLAFLIAFFNQLSGINFVLYYAPEILEIAGLATKESLFNSIAIGGINLIFTFVGISLIDRIGRRQLLIIGSVGYISSLLMIAFSFYADLGAGVLLASIMAFIASHAIGQGAVIWVFIAEIFPNHARAYGTSWGTGTHWVFAALITLLGPVVIAVFKENPWPIFVIFAVMMVFQLLFALFMMPETKGVSLEDIQKKLDM